MSGDKVVVVQEGWVGTAEAHRLTGYSVRYLCQLARENKLKATKLGRDWLFERESLLGWKSRMDAMGKKKHRPRKLGPPQD